MRLIIQLVENQQINVEGEDISIQCDVPNGVNIQVIDGNIAINGSIAAEVKISASRRPQINYQAPSGASFACDFAAVTEQGRIELINPRGKGSMEFTKDGIKVDGHEITFPSIVDRNVINDLPHTKANITITGSIDRTAIITTNGSITVDGKQATDGYYSKVRPEVVEQGQVLSRVGSFFVLAGASAKLKARSSLIKKMTREELSLYKAAEKGNAKEVERLLALGSEGHSSINVNAQHIGSGRTALHIAVINNREQIANLLIQAGARSDIADAYNNKTATDYAMQSEKENMRLLFIPQNSIQIQ